MWPSLLPRVSWLHEGPSLVANLLVKDQELERLTFDRQGWKSDTDIENGRDNDDV